MNKNIVIGILVVIIIALGGYAIWKSGTPAPIVKITDSSQQSAASSSQTQPANTGTTASSPARTASSGGWVLTTAPGFIVSYKSSWVTNPYMYAPPASHNNPSMVGYMFTLPSTSIIEWGGPQSNCAVTSFQFGVSTEACIKGMHAVVRIDNVRLSLSQSDKNAFGDFVQHNQ